MQVLVADEVVEESEKDEGVAVAVALVEEPGSDQFGRGSCLEQ